MCPSSLDAGDPFADARHVMVEQQLVARGIHDVRVLDAMETVPRELFVPPSAQARAYVDSALPIEHHQTISQPYTVAFMCQSLGLTGSERVLEIGTGSGYGAAVLSRLASVVISVERIQELANAASRRLQEAGYSNVEVHVADGNLGWPPAAPYDRIIVTAAAEEVPRGLLDQLKDGGQLLIPVGPQHQTQRLCRITRSGDEFSTTDLGSFRFVPLL